MRSAWTEGLALALALAGCNEGGTGQPTDTAVDMVLDVVEEGGDLAMDQAQDPVEEPESEPEPVCLYPLGPYGFSEVGQIAGPMAWPMSVKGPEETMGLDHADLEAFYCDPGVQSVIVVIATTWCPYCPNRVRNLAGLHDHYETYGARFVWVLGDGTSPAQAYDYFSGYGADFGWFTDDADNTLGAHIITGSSMLEGVPWVFVMDGESMEILYDNPTSVYTITKDLYED